MRDFNKIAETVHKEDDDFYRSRGVLIHSLEVSGYRYPSATPLSVCHRQRCAFSTVLGELERFGRACLCSQESSAQLLTDSAGPCGGSGVLAHQVCGELDCADLAADYPRDNKPHESPAAAGVRERVAAVADQG